MLSDVKKRYWDIFVYMKQNETKGKFNLELQPKTFTVCMEAYAQAWIDAETYFKNHHNLVLLDKDKS